MEQIKLDIVPAGVAPVAHASQFDNGRQIRFNLFNQGTPYTLTGAETVTMVVNGEEENITNTSDNYVIWDVAKEDCEEVGVIGCELRIVLGSMLIGSKNFFLEVEMDPYNGKNIRVVTVGPADICTFETNLPEPLQSVKCEINAKQDLHGYDHPWPAGGGKNQLNYNEWKKSGFIRASGVWENNGVTITATENDGYTQYNAPAFTAQVAVSAGESIWLSWEESTNKDGQIYLFTSRNGQLGARTNVNNAYAKSLHYVVTAEDEGYISFRFGVTNQGETISYKNIQIEKGSAATPYEPYENICPISGHTEANITRCGVNLWDETYYISSSRIQSNFIRVAPNTTYYRVTPNNIIPFFYDVDKNLISTGTWGTGVFTTPNNCYFIHFQVDPVYGETYHNDISINYPSTDTTYHAYNGNTVTIAFGQTVYGGVLDATRGKLTVTHAIIDLGDINWNYNSTYTRFIATVNFKGSGSNSIPSDIKCTCYQNVALINVSDLNIALSGDGDQLQVIDLNYTDKDTFISAITGQKLAYKLATPFDIDLTPEVISAIVGENNVFADCGQTTVKYLEVGA